MKIFGYGELGLAPKGGVIALGFFDGVHEAHRKIFETASKEAKKAGVPFGVFTFSSESDIKSGTKRLYSTEERLGIIAGLGADYAVAADFSEICSLTAEEFVKDVLIGGLDASLAVAGYNFRFGKGALGTEVELLRLMQECGRDAIIIREIRLLGNEVSATAIRSLIESGKIGDANRLLGSPYSFTGRVIHGNSKGEKLGFPTVNTEVIKSKVTPPLGVYRSLVLADERIYDAVTNIGTCPTLGEREVHLETHIIGFSGDLYGKNIKVFILEFLREERLFPNEKELIKQINIDKNTTIQKNGEEKWQELGLK